MSVVVKVKKKSEVPKFLVQNVSMYGRYGELVAILGPSGAGKTTFLDALTFNSAPNLNAAGHLEVEGTPIASLQEFLKLGCVYIPQHDTYWSTLSCRDCIKYAAKFCFVGEQVQEERVKAILKLMG